MIDGINENLNTHSMHRQRMRERANLAGITSMKPHEVMEIVLFCAYRRMNTNEIAHALIKHFGSVGAVFAATEEELMTVKDVGYHAAKVIRAFSNAMEAYRMLSREEKVFILTRAQATEYARSQFANEIRPQTRFMLIDGNGCLSLDSRIPAGAIWLNSETLRLIILRALQYKAHYAVILSKKNLRMNGVSPAERIMVGQLFKTLKSVDITLIDYILVTPEKTVSLRRDLSPGVVLSNRTEYGINIHEQWLSDPGDVWEDEPFAENGNA